MPSWIAVHTKNVWPNFRVLQLYGDIGVGNKMSCEWKGAVVSPQVHVAFTILMNTTL